MITGSDIEILEVADPRKRKERQLRKIQDKVSRCPETNIHVPPLPEERKRRLRVGEGVLKVPERSQSGDFHGEAGRGGGV